jgi:hypothetical protein
MRPEFDESLRLTPEQAEKVLAEMQMKASSKVAARQESYKWAAYNYRELLELAKQTRNILLAVLAELHRLHFQAWKKKEPIEFGNSVIEPLGFNRHDKIRALRVLEKAGWISVQWHRRKLPKVTILKGIRCVF